VILDLRTEQEVRSACRELIARFPEVTDVNGGARIIVQPMVLGGVETLVGMVDNPAFGPLVAFGLGGIETEALRDVVFRLAPLSEQDADRLVRGIRSAGLLQAYRGRPAADIDSLKDVLLRVSMLAQHVPELRELDLNPVVVLATGGGCRIVDARARVCPTDQLADGAQDGLNLDQTADRKT
jgi:acyl-CoA synthetase (NDP forming)